MSRKGVPNRYLRPTVTKTCAACSFVMNGVDPNRRFCPTCVLARNAANKRNRRPARISKHSPRPQASIREDQTSGPRPKKPLVPAYMHGTLQAATADDLVRMVHRILNNGAVYVGSRGQ